MKKRISEFSPEEWEAAFGELTGDERDQFAAHAGDEDFDPAVEAKLNSAMRAASPPAMPEGFDRRVTEAIEGAFESRNVEVKSEGETRAPSNIVPIKGQNARPGQNRGWFGSLLQPGPLIGFAVAAAAVVISVMWLESRTDQSGGFVPRGTEMVKATRVKLLTPGEVTGFSEPTFTWETDNGGVVELVIAEADTGKELERKEFAYSPVRFDGLRGTGSLVAGNSYTVKLKKVGAGETVLAERTFTPSAAAASSPKKENTIDGIVKQCEDYLLAGRPADAWMIWAELTETEKQDPRMIELRDRIRGGLG